MSTDEYVPHEDDVRAAWVGRLGTDTPLFTDEAEAEFDRFLARVRRDAVEEYKDRQVQIHISPAPTRIVPMPVRCPKCGYR